MGKKKKADKPAEDKHEKFKRVVLPRVLKAIKAIRLIGNQAGSAYNYTEQDVANIVAALREEVNTVEKRYAGSGKQAIEFSLDSD